MASSRVTSLLLASALGCALGTRPPAAGPPAAEAPPAAAPPAAASPPAPAPPPALAAGAAIDGTLTAGAPSVFALELATGAAATVVADELTLDLSITCVSPDGKRTEVDTGAQATETVECGGGGAGTWLVEVREYTGSAGAFRLRVPELLSAEEREARRAREEALSASVGAWLGEAAHRLATADPDAPLTDLAPLRALVGSARVVGLGEATHGTREFFQLKHRILEYLVTELGFTAFAMEATLPEALDGDRYVTGGAGDPARVLAGLYFWTWQTEEVVELLRWLRRWNADPRHSRKVHFYGFDMQTPTRAAREVRAWFRRVDPAEARAWEPWLAELSDPYLADALYDRPQAELERLRALADALVARFDARRSVWSARAGAARWDLARRHARVLAQCLELASAPPSDVSVRDRAMAENVRWILEREGSRGKVVLWAHNGHVQKRAPFMGDHLRAALGADYLNLGFVMGEGTFQALDGGSLALREFQVGRGAVGTLDRAFLDAGLPLALVDLRTRPKDGPVAEWFGVQRGIRSVGAAFGADQAEAPVDRVLLDRSFDLALFVPRMSAARRLAERPAIEVGPPRNLGFEAEEPEAGGSAAGKAGGGVPGWRLGPLAVYDFHAEAAEDHALEGRRVLRIRRAPGPHPGERAARVEQWIDAAPFKGKRVRFSAAVRVAGAGEGAQAHLELRVADGPFATRPPSADEACREGAPGWHRHEAILEVPADARRLRATLAMTGEGTVDFDAVQIEALP